MRKIELSFEIGWIKKLRFYKFGLISDCGMSALTFATNYVIVRKRRDFANSDEKGAPFFNTVACEDVLLHLENSKF